MTGYMILLNPPKILRWKCVNISYNRAKLNQEILMEEQYTQASPKVEWFSLRFFTFAIVQEVPFSSVETMLQCLKFDSSQARHLCGAIASSVWGC